MHIIASVLLQTGFFTRSYVTVQWNENQFFF